MGLAFDFFEYIEEYLKKVKYLQHDAKSNEISNKCSNINFLKESSKENEEIASNVCPDFIKLYKSLTTGVNNVKECIEPRYDCGFINYWVNFKIAKSRGNESHCITDFYKHIKNKFQNIFNNDINLMKCIYDIKSDEMDKMNILYSLYETI
ncbi:hypothetical protein PCYB_003940, partial [Plasmodium cynomolgi strain B]